MPTNLFLFTGDEPFLLRQEVNRWKEGFREKHGDLNLISLDAAEVSIGQILTDIQAMPFLGDRRLIFIEGLPDAPKARDKDKEELSEKDEVRDEELKKLAAELEEIPETSLVVFVQPNPDKRLGFYKKLLKIATLKEFKPLAGLQLTEWVQRRMHDLGAMISPSTAEYLISLTGPDLWRLNQEVAKLASFHGREPVTRDAIDDLVTPTLEANIFHFTDALGARDHRKAIQNLHRTMAAGENLRQAFYMIVRQFRLFLQVLSYVSANPNAESASIAATLKIHPFVARNTLGQVRRYSMPELKLAYASLLDIDLAMKTSVIRTTTDDQDELALAIEKFIVTFCRTSQ